MVCHEAVGPSSRCRLGRPILAASLPDTRDPSRPGCPAADDASDPQLECPVLILYSPFIVRPSQGVVSGPRGRYKRPDSQSPLPTQVPSLIDLMRMLLSGDLRSQGRVHARSPESESRSGAAKQPLRRPPRPHLLSAVASAVSAAARPLLAVSHCRTCEPRRPICGRFRRSLPGAPCVTTVTTGSHPKPSVLVVLSSPDLVAGAGVPKLSWSVKFAVNNG